MARVNLSDEAPNLVTDIKSVGYMNRGDQGTAERVGNLRSDGVHSSAEVEEISSENKVPHA